MGVYSVIVCDTCQSMTGQMLYVEPSQHYELRGKEVVRAGKLDMALSDLQVSPIDLVDIWRQDGGYYNAANNVAKCYRCHGK